MGKGARLWRGCGAGVVARWSGWRLPVGDCGSVSVKYYVRIYTPRGIRIRYTLWGAQCGGHCHKCHSAHSPKLRSGGGVKGPRRPHASAPTRVSMPTIAHITLQGAQWL